MDEILPPGIFVEFEKAWVVKQAEAVGNFPLDLKVGGIECLRLRWCDHGEAHQRQQQMKIPQPHQITPPVNPIGFWQGKTAELWQFASYGT